MAEAMTRGHGKRGSVASAEMHKARQGDEVPPINTGNKSNEATGGSKGKKSAKAKSVQVVSTDICKPGPSQENQLQQPSEFLAVLKSIRDMQAKQDERFSTIENKISHMQSGEFGSYYDDEYDLEQLDEEQDVVCTDKTSEPPEKVQKLDDKPSRFSSMSKLSKNKELCDKDFDSVLAENINEIFKNGMNEEQYVNMTKDENNGRPSNCEGLVTVRLNQLIWDIISPEARNTDKKMQNIELNVVKAATILAKIVDKMAKQDNEDIDIDGCNDVLAMLGHANRQINLTRREFIKPELRYEYLHLCAQSVPFTKLLYGDDVSKTAKEIEDCSKIGHRLQFDRQFRPSGSRSRSSNPRGRTRGRGRASMRGSYRGSSRPFFNQSKNLPRAGGSGTYQKNKPY